MKTHNEIKKSLSGPIPSISTPYTKYGKIDYPGLCNMIDFLIDAKAKAIVLTAGDSHYFAMSDAEVLDVTKATVNYVAGRAITVAADCHYNTHHAINFAKEVSNIGADVLMLMPPDWAESNTPLTLAEHYSKVAEIIPVMIVTNIFIKRGEDFGIETIRQALKMSSNIVSVKDDMCGDFATKIATKFGEDCAIWAGGQKVNHLNMAHHGASGYLSTFLKFKPEVARDYWNACESDDWEKAEQIVTDIDAPFFEIVKSFEGGFDAGIHAALEIFGIAGRWRPLPYLNASDREVELLREFFRKKNLI